MYFEISYTIPRTLKAKVLKPSIYFVVIDEIWWNSKEFFKFHEKQNRFVVSKLQQNSTRVQKHPFWSHDLVNSLHFYKTFSIILLPKLVTISRVEFENGKKLQLISWGFLLCQLCNINYSVKNSTVDCKYLLYFHEFPDDFFKQSATLAFSILFWF